MIIFLGSSVVWVKDPTKAFLVLLPLGDEPGRFETTSQSRKTFAALQVERRLAVPKAQVKHFMTLKTRQVLGCEID